MLRNSFRVERAFWYRVAVVESQEHNPLELKVVAGKALSVTSIKRWRVESFNLLAKAIDPTIKGFKYRFCVVTH